MNSYVKPKMSFSLLPLKEMLPIIREAYDNKTLQMFKKYDGSRPDRASYNGPCALGVCMTQEQRNYGDDNEFEEYDINSLRERNIVIIANEEEATDVGILQVYHDCAMGYNALPEEEHTKRVAEFENYLSQLEAKYL